MSEAQSPQTETPVEEGAQGDGQLLLANGFDEGLVGIAEICGRTPFAVYDIDKCVKILMDRDGCTYEEAQEWMSFNVINAYQGDGTPAFMVAADKDWTIKRTPV